MNSDLYFEGKKYISARRAAQVSGYSTDYIGQLCRAKNLECRMIGRGWFVSEISLAKYQNSFSEVQPKILSDSNKIPDSTSTSHAETADKKEAISSGRGIRDGLNSIGQFVYSYDDKPLIPEIKKNENKFKEDVAVKNVYEIKKSDLPVLSPLDDDFKDSKRNFQTVLQSGKVFIILSAIVLSIFFIKDNSLVKGFYEESLSLSKGLSQNTLAFMGGVKNYFAIGKITDKNKVFQKLPDNKLSGNVEEISAEETSTNPLNNFSLKIYSGVSDIFSKTKNYFAGFFGKKNYFTNNEIIPIKQSESHSGNTSSSSSIINVAVATSFPNSSESVIYNLQPTTYNLKPDITRREVLDLIKQYDGESKALIYATSAITGANSTTVNQTISDLKNKINSLEQKESLVPRQLDHAYNSISRSIDDITSLDGVAMTNSSFSGTTGTFTGVFSGAAGTFSGNLTIGSQLIVSGTATSTLAGDTNFDSGTLYIDSINNRVGIASSSPSETLSVNGAPPSPPTASTTPPATSTGTATLSVPPLSATGHRSPVMCIVHRATSASAPLRPTGNCRWRALAHLTISSELRISPPPRLPLQLSLTLPPLL
ncbi:MAG: hypothetical protein HW401_78 [Parcubacteria group bacterium]|nr:hypothetical protein [Parcubacteria group bacterium]